MVKEYAVYKGDEMICIGSMAECADHMGVKIETIQFYLTPSHQKRVAKRKRSRKAISITRLDD